VRPELSVSEQRYQALLAVVADGLSVTHRASRSGSAGNVGHAWLPAMPGGPEWLSDLSHRPRRCPHHMDASVEVRFVELRVCIRVGARIG